VSSSLQMGLLFPGRLCTGEAAAMTPKASAVGKGLEPGANRSPLAGRLPGQ
jgi:hypothetical protein